MRLLGIGLQCVQVELDWEDCVLLAGLLDGDGEYDGLGVAFRSLAGLAALRGDLPVHGYEGVAGVIKLVGLPDSGGIGVGGSAAGSP